MEADWEFEIGDGAPVIEAPWSGFIDLRTQPERVSELRECRGFPELADALVRLNATDSPVWSSKTDVFTPERIDPDEMDASPEESRYALSCYVDLLLRGDQIWNSPSKAKVDCERICAKLRAVILECCRADIVVRRALLGDMHDLGTTVYLTACGRTPLNAKKRLGVCLAAFAEAMVSR